MSKILIVEDDDVTAKLLNSVLSGKGYQVKTLNGGKELANVVSKFKPDLILMDLLLPDIDGAEAVKALKEEGLLGDIAVIFLSGIIEQDNDKTNTISVDDKDYPALSKSTTTNELIKAIQAALRK
ncbi:MAG TPA: response regulator [Candidatus Omnitrophota bacterium]|nr:response regulator [Candidatus Omnitrophota bacterium]